MPTTSHRLVAIGRLHSHTDHHTSITQLPRGAIVPAVAGTTSGTVN